MILREAVVDGRGRLILPKGESLDANILERLARFAIRNVDVEGVAGDVPDPGAEPQGSILPGVTLQTILENIERRYVKADDDPRMAAIRAAFKRVLSK